MLNLYRIIFSITTLFVIATYSIAEEVKIAFDTNSCFVADSNNARVETSFPYVFERLKLGGRCGTAVAKYLAGQTTNNLLTKGMTCIVKGRVKSLAGKALKKKNLLIANEKGTARASVEAAQQETLNYHLKLGPLGLYLTPYTDIKIQMVIVLVALCIHMIIPYDL
jgi:hypothetical protein